MNRLFAAAVAALLPLPAVAFTPPQPASPTPPIVAPRDMPYPGTLMLAVDATDVGRRIVRVRETIPAAAGPMTLLFPEWLPGKHSPRGPVDKLAGLIIRSGGTRLDWTRDPVDTYAFHLDVPDGATALDVEFQYLSPTELKQDRIEITPDLMNLQWTSLALYPAGYFTRGIMVAASLTLPPEWQFGTALETANRSGATTVFKPVPFDVLADSPVFAGRYFRRVELSRTPVPVHLNIVADRPEQLLATEAQLAPHRALVAQAYKLFGSQHFDHYDFLLGLSDKMGGIGLEHHRSSENGTRPDYFTDWAKTVSARQLLPHEFTHSWNGKFRRGADAWTPTFNTPMRNSLLWVYEGQTQYWGVMLAARSGMQTKAQVLDALALTAATFDARIGRAWKPLIDTTNDPITTARRPEPWLSWQRSEDYYSEGLLIWLDADTLIRERSRGKRSLDDFARRFFGVEDGNYSELTYTFDDVVAALNAVEPYDWAAFLRTRLDGHGPGAPLDGLARGGYHLVFTDVQSDYTKGADAIANRTDLSFSLGFVVDKDRTLSAVQWDGPAFKAGLTAGTQLIAVNGDPYEPDVLKTAITAARAGAPLELLVKAADRFRMVRIEYRGGLRYPHLQPTGPGAARLDAILAPR